MLIKLKKVDICQIAIHLLQVIQPRVISYEEQAAEIRQALAEIYEKEENWREAAKVLVGIPLETGQRLANIIIGKKYEQYLTGLSKKIHGRVKHHIWMH